MLYIQPVMLEPTTVSIGLYLLAKSPSTITKTHKYINRNPILLKKKICKWILKHHEPLIDTIIDENNENLLSILNLVNFNPSIFLLIYLVALFLIVIF